jgi:hypothetical protein
MAEPRFYQPKPQPMVEAMQWNGDWEAVSLWVYGRVLTEAEVEAGWDDSSFPVVDSAGTLDLLDTDGSGNSMVRRGDYLLRLEDTWTTLEEDTFDAIYSPVSDLKEARDDV